MEMASISAELTLTRNSSRASFPNLLVRFQDEERSYEFEIEITEFYRSTSCPFPPPVELVDDVDIGRSFTVHVDTQQDRLYLAHDNNLNPVRLVINAKGIMALSEDYFLDGLPEWNTQLQNNLLLELSGGEVVYVNYKTWESNFLNSFQVYYAELEEMVRNRGGEYLSLNTSLEDVDYKDKGVAIIGDMPLFDPDCDATLDEQSPE
ncbi:MAG: hypothetical protein AAGD25_25210 [Cyanobacteria bacterium P01_F01_bin.150]